MRIVSARDKIDNFPGFSAIFRALSEAHDLDFRIPASDRKEIVKSSAYYTIMINRAF